MPPDKSPRSIPVRQFCIPSAPPATNVLEFNNFCMMNLVELVSKSQRFQSSKFMVQVLFDYSR